MLVLDPLANLSDLVVQQRVISHIVLQTPTYGSLCGKTKGNLQK